MNSELDEFAHAYKARLVAANRNESEGKAITLAAQQESATLKSALDRIDLLESGDRKLAIDECIECFIDHGVISKMTQPSSDSDVDLFHCHKCGYRKEVEP